MMISGFGRQNEIKLPQRTSYCWCHSNGGQTKRNECSWCVVHNNVAKDSESAMIGVSIYSADGRILWWENNLIIQLNSLRSCLNERMCSVHTTSLTISCCRSQLSTLCICNQYSVRQVYGHHLTRKQICRIPNWLHVQETIRFRFERNTKLDTTISIELNGNECLQPTRDRMFGRTSDVSISEWMNEALFQPNAIHTAALSMSNPMLKASTNDCILSVCMWESVVGTMSASSSIITCCVKL